MKVKLLVVRGQPHGKNLLFPQGEFVIGRGNECHIRPNSDWVSRQHCMLRVTENSVSINDLGSTNGTLVNGTRILGEQVLAHGDHVQVGPLVFEVRLEAPVSVTETTPTPVTPSTFNAGAAAPVRIAETVEMLHLPDQPPAPPLVPEKSTLEIDLVPRPAPCGANPEHQD